MNNYHFTFKDNNPKTYNLFTWFLFFLHFIAAGWFALKTSNGQIKLSMYILLGFYILISMGYFYFRKHKNAWETYSLILALLYVNFWFTQVGVMAVLVFAAVYIFARVVKGKKITAHFSEQGVAVNRLFKTSRYAWPVIENVILKDGLLTIDLTSNTFIQAEIEKAAEAIDEKEFNGFCTAKLQHRY